MGRDQIQHIEMARDFAQRFNHIYGGEYFVLPEAAIDEQVATLPGLDGRKMSKSYGNTMPLFCTREELKKYVFRLSPIRVRQGSRRRLLVRQCSSCIRRLLVLRSAVCSRRHWLRVSGGGGKGAFVRAY